MKPFPKWHQLFVHPNPSRLESAYYGVYYFLLLIPRSLISHFIVPIFVGTVLMPLRGVRDLIGMLAAGVSGNLRVADITLEERRALDDQREHLLRLEAEERRTAQDETAGVAAQQAAQGS